MTMIRKSKFKLVASIALVALMSFSMILPALAAPLYTTGTSSTSPARAAITKVFRMPIISTTPSGQFTFSFSPVGMAAIEDGQLEVQPNTTTGMPSIDPLSLTYTKNDAGASVVVANGVKSLVKEVEIPTNTMINTYWTKGAGIYVYSLVESVGTIDLEGYENEGSSKSNAEYTLEFWVEEDTGGTLYVRYFVARVSNDTAKIDEYYKEGNNGGKKVDATPGGGSGAPLAGFSQLIFTNSYWRSDGGGDPKPEETALEIIKTVNGMGMETDKDFVFTIKATRPSVIPASEPASSYITYIVDADGNRDNKREVGSGEVFSVNLKHNEKLIFVDLHVGAVVEVSEEGDDEYKISYKRTFAGPDLQNNQVDHEDYGFPNSSDLGKHYLEESKNFNKVDFFNTRTDGVTPTGIEVDDIPYIVLIGIAIAGIVAFVVVKSRKRAEEDVI